MPLGVQALLPLVTLLIAATGVAARPRRAGNGWVAVGGTGVAALTTLIELLRLSPGERVDVPYLTTFPYADLAIHIDALSLAFATMTLATAALLMLARLRTPGDRRDPWVSWLLTSVAVLAVILAQSLLLIYILLQVLTLAWSGTLDEAAPRRRRLRLLIVVADVGLLLVAAGAIQSVGTSAFSGVPSDTFGPAALLLALIPVLTRLGALAWASGARMTPVAFEPAVAWAAPAAYLLTRLLALTGGRLPGRPLEIVIFSSGLLIATAAALRTLLSRPSPGPPIMLLVAQSGLALALGASSSPLLVLASLWIWLQLIPLAGLCSIRLAPGSPAEAAAVFSLSMLPGSAAFISVWIGTVVLWSGGKLLALLLTGIVVALTAAAALSRMQAVKGAEIDVGAGWAGALLLLGAFPIAGLGLLALPAAQTVRALPGGTVLLSPLGFTVSGAPWPALLATLTVVAAIALIFRRSRISFPPPPRIRLPALAYPGLPAVPPFSLRWTTRALWSAFVAIILFAVLRP